MLTPRLELKLDLTFDAARSVVLRYAPALLEGLLSGEELRTLWRGEGVRLAELGEIGGVGLWVMDETTAMASGTHKSLDGLLTTAFCRRQGIRRAAFSSGANAGSALTLYGASADLETFFFCPANNLGKLDGGLFKRPTAHLVAVEGSDRRVKEACRLFAEASGMPVVPLLEWRVLSGACRGMFIAEQFLAGRKFDWLVQSVCAGYGPIGIYHALEALVCGGQYEQAGVPRFLGVQQAGLCPVVSAWSMGLASLPPLGSTAWREAPIEPALYNVYPDGTYPLLHRLLSRWGGDMLAVSESEFRSDVEVFASLLERAGVRLTRISNNGKSQYLDRAGLLAGVGAIRAIRSGRIPPGQRVLCALTGGAGPAPASPARPDCRIRAEEPLDSVIGKLAEELGGRRCSEPFPKGTGHED